MELKNFYVQDAQGNVIRNATIYVYQPGTSTLAAGLKKSDGTDRGNPFTSSGDGLVAFAAPDGDYDVRAVGAGRDGTMRVRFIDSVAYGAQLGTIQGKLGQFLNPMDAAFGGAGNGTANDRAALALADAAGPVFITGNHRVGSDVAFANPVTFVGKGRLTIDAGVTVSFPGGITAPSDLQIFYGAGAVSGLRECFAEWFAGDAKVALSATPTVESRARLQKALDAVQDGGTVRAGVGAWLVDGSVALTIVRGQSFIGAGDRETVFRWQGAATAGFAIAGAVAALAERFRFEPATPGTIPTGGTAVAVATSNVVVRDYTVEDPYNGTTFTDAGECIHAAAAIRGALNVGLGFYGTVISCRSSDVGVVSLYDYATFSVSSGTVGVGEQLTLAGGQAAWVRAKYSATRYRIEVSGPKPANGVAFTASGGASGTISSITAGHQTGGLHAVAHMESCTINDMDILGGEISHNMVDTGPADRDSMAFTRFKDCFFDTCYQSNPMSGMYGVVFSGCWWASTRNTGAKGIEMNSSKRVIFNACQFVNCADSAVGMASSCRDIQFIAVTEDGNCTRGGAGAFYVTGGVVGLQFIGGRAGYQGANGITPPKSLYLDSAGGGTDQVKIIGADFAAGSVVNLATGANQEWRGVTGISDRVPLAKVPDAANDTAAAAAGVPVGGEYRNGSVRMIRVA